MAPFPLLILLIPAILFSSAFSDQLSRRILHQPFLPEGSQPPHPSPPPPTSPDIPFTPATNSTPFFPEITSPPPPSPASFASVPANISSLTLPESSKSRPANKKLVPAAIASVIAAVFVVSIAVALHLRRRRRRRSSSSGSDAKTQRSDSTVRPSFAAAGGGIPKLQRPSQTSSEFLYLGTLVNSHGAIDSSVIQQQNPRASSTADGSSAANSRKFDSPELRPLPPLAVHSLRRHNRSGDAGFSIDDDAEEFYSPRGSLAGSTGTGSASRRGFPGVEVEKLMHSSSTSSSSSSSGSDSPARSVSLSISPPASRSPKISRPKSPELVALQSVPPPPPSRPPPPPLPLYSVQWAPRQQSEYSLSPSASPSPSPPSSSSPERVYSRSRESSPRFFDSPMSIRRPPALPPVQPISIPPPPPPPPPGKNWESPRTPAPAISKMANKPPALVTALKPMSLESPNLISPMELSGNSKPHEKNDDIDDDTFELRNISNEEETPKPKLKPLHWDKVRASSDREMVWDQLKSSSFKLNEEMIETLFVVNNPAPGSKENSRRPILPSPTQENRVLDPKKSQNISILLRAVNVTVDEVCEALVEGNVDTLGTDLLESLLKMAPTKEEERKLKEYKDDSPYKLGPAEKFLKALLDIPSAFKRVDAMLYISNFESEIEYLKRSFDTLEAACEELRSSRMFLKLLEAVLKTGNRMNVGTNRGDAHAFKLDTLLKLVDVKGADGKTTLLHFVVQEIIRSEGARHASANQDGTTTVNDDIKCRRLGLQVVSGLSSDLTNVKKAAAMDSEVLNSEVQKLSIGISKIAEVVRSIDESDPFAKSMNGFMKMAEEEIIRIQAQESVALTLVKEITEYFHGNSAKEEAHPFRIFMVVRDFLAILDRVCKEVGMINDRIVVSSAHKFPVPVNPNLHPTPSGGFAARRSSDEDDSF